MKTKILAVLAMLFVATIAFAGIATAQVEYEVRDETNATTQETAELLNVGNDNLIDVMWVKVDGDRVETGTGITEKIERGQTLEVKVKVQANADVEKVNVFAIISGDERTVVSENSGVFDLNQNERTTVTLDVTLPDIFEADYYSLRILVLDNTGYTKSYNYPLHIARPRHSMIIKDVYFSANSGKVMAGRSIFPVIRVANLGEKKQEDVRIEVSIPELGISAVDYIEKVGRDDQISSEELMLTIPQHAADGLYELVVTMKYDALTRKVSKVVDIEVYGGKAIASPDKEETAPAEDTKSGKTIVTIGPESQDVLRGEGGAIFPITLTNEGSTSKSYTIGVSGTSSFATVEISPSNLVVLAPSASETVYVYVSAREEASLGAHTFTVDIKSGDETLQQIPLSANVVEPAGSGSFKKGLEIGLIVLIIILIILGLVVVFNKAKKAEAEEDEDMNEEEDQVSGQTYY